MSAGWLSRGSLSCYLPSRADILADMIVILTIVAGVLAAFVIFAIAFTMYGLHKRKRG